MKKLFFLLCMMNFIACKKQSVNKPLQVNSADFSEIFNSFWHNMNNNYVYWSIDTTDWNNVYKTFKPLFAELELQSDEDIKKSVRYFKQITAGLIDAHYSISFINRTIRDSSIRPAFSRKMAKQNFHNPYSYTDVVKRYLDPGYISGYDSTTDKGNLLYCLSGKIEKRIIYFTCNRFSLMRSNVSPKKNGVQAVLQDLFSGLNNSNIKGFILDVRGNPGGDLSDLNFIIGQLIDKPLHFGFTRYKSGNAKLDYTGWVEAVINPQFHAKNFSLPIIVLADNFSASLSELITIAVQTLPNGFFIGEPTYGATGPLTLNEVYNNGSFIVKDFLSVQTSSAMFKYLDGKIYEGEGFLPDIFMPHDLSSLKAGIDLQLEKAISLIP